MEMELHLDPKENAQNSFGCVFSSELMGNIFFYILDQESGEIAMNERVPRQNLVRL